VVSVETPEIGRTHYTRGSPLVKVIETAGEVDITPPNIGSGCTCLFAGVITPLQKNLNPAAKSLNLVFWFSDGYSHANEISPWRKDDL
jgi:hypothetical protein